MNKMNWNLQGKKALITGGTRGIGRATVDMMCDLGAEVLAVARTRPDDFPERAGIHFLAGEVGRTADRAEWLDWVQNRWEKLDILVNNAGTNIRKAAHAFTEEEIHTVLNTNLMSAFELTRASLPLLTAAGNASVVMVSSVAGSVDVGTGAPYGMSKAAMIQLSRNLGGEWAKHGIRVNTVSPWYIDTPLAAPVLAQPERLERILMRTPIQRVGRPEEVAAAISFLCMDLAGYITGQNLAVDGGMLAWGL